LAGSTIVFTPSLARADRNDAQKLRVAIVQHISAGMKITPSLLRRAASDLFHPLLIRVPGDPGYVEASAFQMKEEQYIISHSPRQLSTSTVKKSHPASTFR